VNATLYFSYADLNAAFAGLDWYTPLDNDHNTEDPALILLVYKWHYERGADADPPYLPGLGLEYRETVNLNDKLDAFVYVRR
jgi:hypothetical protein